MSSTYPSLWRYYLITLLFIMIFCRLETENVKNTTFFIMPIIINLLPKSSLNKNSKPFQNCIIIKFNVEKTVQTNR